MELLVGKVLSIFLDKELALPTVLVSLIAIRKFIDWLI